MSEEFILKVCESFQKRADTLIEKMVAIMNKFTVLCLSFYFVVVFFKSKLIFFEIVVYYYARIFLNFPSDYIYIYIYIYGENWK